MNRFMFAAVFAEEVGGFEFFKLNGQTPLDLAIKRKPETADLLRKHGGKMGEELKAEGK